MIITIWRSNMKSYLFIVPFLLILVKESTARMWRRTKKKPVQVAVPVDINAAILLQLQMMETRMERMNGELHSLRTEFELHRKKADRFRNVQEVKVNDLVKASYKLQRQVNIIVHDYRMDRWRSYAKSFTNALSKPFIWIYNEITDALYWILFIFHAFFDGLFYSDIKFK